MLAEKAREKRQKRLHFTECLLSWGRRAHSLVSADFRPHAPCDVCHAIKGERPIEAPPLKWQFFQAKEKKHKHEKVWGIVRDWVGGKNLFIFLGSHSLWGENTSTKFKRNPLTIPRKCLFMCFLLRLFFRSQISLCRVGKSVLTN